jgi:hypothetical protein
MVETACSLDHHIQLKKSGVASQEAIRQAYTPKKDRPQRGVLIRQPKLMKHQKKTWESDRVLM